MKIDKICKACERNLMEQKDDKIICLWCTYEEPVPKPQEHSQAFIEAIKAWRSSGCSISIATTDGC